VITPERGVRLVDALITGWQRTDASHYSCSRRSPTNNCWRELRGGRGSRLLWHEFGDSCLICLTSSVAVVRLQTPAPCARLIDTRYAEPLDVDELARVACASRAHFSRASRACSETPHRYLIQRRVERASTCSSWVSRSSRSGCPSAFQSAASFSTAFAA